MDKPDEELVGELVVVIKPGDVLILLWRRMRAQVGLERERNAYWIRKNAEKLRRQDRPSKQERAQARQPLPNRADMRANQAGGMIWSQRHRPARPSDTILRQYKPLGFVDETMGAER